MRAIPSYPESRYVVRRRRVDGRVLTSFTTDARFIRYVDAACPTCLIDGPAPARRRTGRPEARERSPPRRSPLFPMRASLPPFYPAPTPACEDARSTLMRPKFAAFMTAAT